MDYIRVKHSFNAGDLITVMAGLRQMSQDKGVKVKLFQRLDLPAFYYDGQINATTDKDGQSVCMNENMFYKLKPLIESQDYIESFEVWEGQDVHLNFDVTRDSRATPMPNGTLYSWNESIFPEAATDLSIPWLNVDNNSIKRDYYKDKIIINRTQRYINPYIDYYFLKDYEDVVLFSGTDDEHTAFCSQWNLNLKKLEVNNFYHLAQIISWSKFGIYNQSMNFHIADALKAPRILELCGQFPNTFITGANGFQFYKGEAMRFYFNKLNNLCSTENSSTMKHK